MHSKRLHKEICKCTLNPFKLIVILEIALFLYIAPYCNAQKTISDHKHYNDSTNASPAFSDDSVYNTKLALEKINAAIDDYITKHETLYDFTALFEETRSRLGNKTDINALDEETLLLIGLNEHQIIALSDYITKYGYLTSVYELNLVEGFDSTLISRIKPMIWFNTNQELHKINFTNLTKNGKHTLITRYERVLQRQQGYLESKTSEGEIKPAKYTGNPDKWLYRYKYNYYDRLNFGFTGEKDPGENNYLDYFSYYLFYKGSGLVRSLALGDYDLSFGQGLTIHTGFNLSRNSTTPLTRRFNSLTARTGANETGGLRGAAITIAPISTTSITLFYSDKPLDATQVITDSLLDERLITSIFETGLHRTPLERSKKHVISQKTYGANITTTYKYLTIGATSVTTQTNGKFTPQTEPYKLFLSKENHLNNYGLDFSFNYKTIEIIGEAARSSKGGQALITGLVIHPNSDYTFSLLYRKYSKEYINDHALAFSQNSSNNNEEGFYLSFLGKTSKKLTLTGYADLFRFSWLKYMTNAPSTGSEYSIKGIYAINTRADFALRYQTSFHMKNPVQGSNSAYLSVKPLNDLDLIPYPAGQTRSNLRLELNFTPSKEYKLQSRVEFVTNQLEHKTHGYLWMQDLKYAPLRLPWVFYFRYCLFDTETYNDRIYAWENDMLYSFSVPVLNGKGQRICITTHYSFNRVLDLWIKYAHTYMPGVRKTGTAEEEITGPLKSELKFQVIIHI